MNKHCNASVKITYRDGRSVVIENLTPEQTRQLSAMLEASDVPYQWSGDYPALRAAQGGRLGALWRRFASWMMAGLILISALSAHSLAQELKPHAIEPMRVIVIAVSADETDTELARLVERELRKTRTVIIGSQGDHRAYLTAGPLSEDGRCRGFVGAMLTVTTNGAPRLSVHTGATLSELAQHLAAKLRAEYSRPGRREKEK